MDYRTMGDIFKGLAASGNYTLQHKACIQLSTACEPDTAVWSVRQLDVVPCIVPSNGVCSCAESLLSELAWL